MDNPCKQSKNDLISFNKRFPNLLYFSLKGELTLKASLKDFSIIFLFLKYHNCSLFGQLIDISAIDHFDRKFRFEVIYQLLSISNNLRITIMINISEGISLFSLESVYSSAN